jgi:predicted transcriptional regulator
MNKGHEAIFELLLKRDSVKAIDVVMELGLGLSNASSKLKQLWEKGYILRNNELAESGGIEYVYYKIK